MKRLIVVIIVVFCSLLIVAWIAAERADPKMIDVDFSRPPTGPVK